jgi:regulator of protease activity HflC (stomatin/prohibitin superfamily)
LVVKCPRIPFSSRALVDEDRLLDLIEELRNLIPPELQQAQEVMAQRDQLLADAKREADLLVNEARRQAHAMTADHVITQEALQEAEKVRKQLEQDLMQQQAGADRYAEELLVDLEAKIARALTIIQNGRTMLNTEKA